VELRYSVSSLYEGSGVSGVWRRSGRVGRGFECENVLLEMCTAEKLSLTRIQRVAP